MNTIELTAVEYEIADNIEAALDEADTSGLTASVAARKASTDTITARRILDWLVASQFAHTSGNGNWTRYHAGRR